MISRGNDKGFFESKANKFERPFASHRANGMLFLQLRSALPLRLSKNWLWVQLIVTRPNTGTMPWYPPRDTQSRGPSLLLTLVHIEQNVESTSHVFYSFFNFGCKTTMFFGVHRYAKCSSLLNKKPNSFTNPPQFAFSPYLNFLVLPRFAFISGRIALIFQNRFAFTSFFRNFALLSANLLSTRKKKQTSLFCSSLVFS